MQRIQSLRILPLPCHTAKQKKITDHLSFEELSAILQERLDFFGGVRDHVVGMEDGIYIECIKQLGDRPFRWTSLHWWASKAVLLDMVKRWNETLEKICDEREIVGPLRESVRARHCAAPFAPCGNPNCNQIETNVKECQKCANCELVAYCSRECQKGCWKDHKVRCVTA